MAAVNLNVPVLQGGIQNTNFFNGRILSAEDLTALQLANAQQHRQLGRALGDGVAWGFGVTLGSNTDPTQPVLHVTSGLAFNRNGEAAALASDVDLALVTSLDAQNAGAGLFAACQPPKTTLPTNLDCYILTVSPASGFQGSAPLAAPTSAGFASQCASAFAVEGVQFGLLPLGVTGSSDTTTLAGQATQLYAALKPLFVQLEGLTGAAALALQAQIAPTLSQFRNVVAHLAFGTDTLAGFAANPLPTPGARSPYAAYGALDALRAQGYLTNCATPLALVYWTAAGIQFVDTWAVRRPLIAAPASLAWPVFSGPRRAAEGLAMFLQFQSHIADLPATLGNAPAGSVSARSYFRYLPPAGLLPITNGGSPAGFDYLQFFANRTYWGPVFMEGTKIESLVAEAALFSPIDLTGQENVWLYSVRENRETIDNNPAAAPQEYLVFASGQTPFQGKARFDSNYWNYANFV